MLDQTGGGPVHVWKKESPMSRERTAVWLFLFVTVVSALAALLPVLRGGPLNTIFFASAGFWLVMTVVAEARVRKAATSRVSNPQ